MLMNGLLSIVINPPSLPLPLPYSLAPSFFMCVRLCSILYKLVALGAPVFFFWNWSVGMWRLRMPVFINRFHMHRGWYDMVLSMFSHVVLDNGSLFADTGGYNICLCYDISAFIMCVHNSCKPSSSPPLP
ncbi:hypothetical protein CsSME_00049588 [Camellia sinensis var. sinensis]